MTKGSFLTSIRLMATLLCLLVFANRGASAFDDAQYPDLKGQWTRVPVPGGQPTFDPAKPGGLGQQAPLTQEYQAIFEANLAEMATGAGGIGGTYRCLSPGMPMVMQAYSPMEIIVTPEATHIMIEDVTGVHRRIYTDGREWQPEIEPSTLGYSIGRWVDAEHAGKYDILEVETRGFKGTRVYDISGLPLHTDNESVIRERIYLDKADWNVLHDQITVIDHALTRPWTVIKNYRRNPNPRPLWREFVCAENNPHILIGNEDYMLSADGLLMPAKKNQSPPDLKYFK